MAPRADATPTAVLTPEQPDRRASADRADDGAVRRAGGGASARPARAARLDGRAPADPTTLRRARPARHRRPRGVRRRRARQGHVARRQRADGAIGVVRRDVRRAGQPHRPAADALRHAGAETASTCRSCCRARLVGAYCLSETGSGSDALGAKTKAVAAGRRQLRPERREDVDHQRRLRRPLHRLREGRRRALHRVHRRTRVRRRDERQGRAQDGPARLVDDGRDPAGREGAGGEPARRDRQGPQGRVQRAELRPLQARRHVQRRRAARDRRVGEVRGAAQAVRAADRAASAPSSTSSAR